MTYCTKPGCKFHQWRNGLCYSHFRQSQGYTFNPQRKTFIKAK